MRAFFDESGMNPHEDKALVMGGFLGTVDAWEKLTDAWDECLHQNPRIEYFKSDEAKHSSSMAGKKKVLAAIIGESSLQGFCASVPYRWFEGRDAKATKSKFGTRPYDWGFLTATSGVLQYMRDVHPTEKVDFIFDERNELRLCRSNLEEMKAIENSPWSEILSRAGTCTPGKDTEVPALQMADMLAGEFSVMGNRGEKPSEVWKLLTRIHPVAHVPCEMPPPIPFLIELHGLRKEIADSTGDFLRRFYKENERSASMLNDFGEIAERAALFEAAMKAIWDLHNADPEFRAFVERAKKEES